MIAPLVLALALTAQSPPSSQANIKAQHAADMKQMVAKKKAIRLNKAARHAAQASRDYEERLRQEAYVARMAPIWAQQRRDAATIALQRQRADALSALAGAAQLEAVTDRQRLAIQARRAGYPQVGLRQAVPALP